MGQDSIADRSGNRDAIVEAIRSLNAIQQTLAAAFPQLTGSAASATGGAATLPANPVTFLTVVDPVSGNTYLIPAYDP